MAAVKEFMAERPYRLVVDKLEDHESGRRKVTSGRLRYVRDDWADDQRYIGDE